MDGHRVVGIVGQGYGLGMDETEFERLTKAWKRDPASGKVVFYELVGFEAFPLSDSTVGIHVTWARDEAHLAAVRNGNAQPDEMNFLSPVGLAESMATKAGLATGKNRLRLANKG